MELRLRQWNGSTIIYDAFINGGIDYSLSPNGWAPPISRLRKDTLSGSGYYEEVTHEITLTILGTTKAVLQANLNKLQYMLDNASEFVDGKTNIATALYYLPDSGTAGTDDLYAIVQEGELIMPPGFADNLVINAIEDVKLKIKTRVFHRFARTIGNCDASGNATIATHPNPSPFTLLLEYTCGTPNTPIIYPGYVLAAPTGRIRNVTAYDGTLSGDVGVTTSTPITNGKTVARFQASTANLNGYCIRAMGATMRAGRYAILATLINQTASDVTVKAQLFSSIIQGVGSFDIAEATSKALSAEALFIGVVNMPIEWDQISLSFVSGASGLDEYVYQIHIVDVTDQQAAIVKMPYIAPVLPWAPTRFGLIVRAPSSVFSEFLNGSNATIFENSGRVQFFVRHPVTGVYYGFDSTYYGSLDFAMRGAAFTLKHIGNAAATWDPVVNVSSSALSFHRCDAYPSLDF